MLRKVVSALFLVALCVGISFAEEFTAAITKVGDGKITFAKTKFNAETKKLEKGESQTLPLIDKVKVVKGKFNKENMKFDAGDEIEDGLKNKMFSDIGDKGVPAALVTDADGKKISEIRVIIFGKKKKDK